MAQVTPETFPEIQCEFRTGESDVGAGGHKSDPSILFTKEPETTVDDINKIIKRLVHRPEAESLPPNPPSPVVAVPESAQRYPTSPTGPTSVGVSRSPPERAARPPVARAQDWDIPAPTWPSPTVVDRPPVAGPSTSSPVDVRVESLPTRHARHHSDEATKMAKTTRKKEASTDVHSGPLLIPEFEPTIDDIIQTVSRSVHRSYVESFLLTQVIQVSHLINWSGQLLPVPSHRSVNPNLSLVWRWKVISDQLCIWYQRRGTRLTPQVDDN